MVGTFGPMRTTRPPATVGPMRYLIGLLAVLALAVGCGGDATGEAPANRRPSPASQAAPSTEVMCSSFAAFVDDGMPKARRSWMVHTLRVRSDGQTEAGVAAAVVDLRRALKRSDKAWNRAAEDFLAVCQRVGWDG